MNFTSPQKAIDILLVEDNPGDIRLTREALKGARIANRLQVAQTGEEALEILRGEAPGETIRPDLVLLDLNLPGMGGHEVLAEIKSDDGLRSIPVVVLTTSESEQDILRSYDLAANCYITKPVDFSQFVDVVNSIEHFWLMVVRLPAQPAQEQG